MTDPNVPDDQGPTDDWSEPDPPADRGPPEDPSNFSEAVLNLRGEIQGSDPQPPQLEDEQQRLMEGDQARHLSPGLCFHGGQYKILEELGRGGQGIVYKVEDRDTGNVLAVKVVFRDRFTGSQFDNLMREARLTTRVKSSHVAHVYGVGEAGDFAWMAMEWVEGPTLVDKVRNEGRLGWVQALKITAQLLQGLKEVHRHGLVHRDIKPGNIRFSRDGFAVKLLDLGLACYLDPLNNAIRDTHLQGTLRYLPYEAWPGPAGEEKHQDVRSDLYSVGATLYEMLSGREPYHDIQLRRDATWQEVLESPLRQAHLSRPLADEVPEDLDLPGSVHEVLATATAADPEKRYATADAFLEAVNAALEPAPEPRRPTPRLPPWLLPACVLLLLLGVAIPAALWTFWSGPHRFKGQLAMFLGTRNPTPELLKKSGEQVAIGKALGGQDDDEILPFRGGDGVVCSARLEEGPAAYFYILYIDSHGAAKPLYPPGWTWTTLAAAAADQPGVELRLPPKGAMKLGHSPAGMEAVLWLVRDTRLTPHDNAELAKLFADLKWCHPAEWTGKKIAVWFEDGRRSMTRGAPEPEVAQVEDDPPSQAEKVLLEIKQAKLARYTRAVCYSFVDR